MYSRQLLRGPVHLGRPCHSVERLPLRLAPLVPRDSRKAIQRWRQWLVRRQCAVVRKAQHLRVQRDSRLGEFPASRLITQSMRLSAVYDVLVLVDCIDEHHAGNLSAVSVREAANDETTVRLADENVGWPNASAI